MQMQSSLAPTLSICLACRDGRESERCLDRGGARLAEAIRAVAAGQDCPTQLRGIRCMSQCKRPCVVSLTAHGAFTYVFGDLDPEDSAHPQAVLDLIALYRATPEGFLKRDVRPIPLRSSILARLPPIGTTNDLATNLDVISDREATK